MDKQISKKINAVIESAEDNGWLKAAKWLYEQCHDNAADALIDESVRRQEKTPGQVPPARRQ